MTIKYPMADEKKEENKAATISDLDQLKKDLVSRQKQAEEYLNGWKRAKADLINFQRESEKRQGELINFAYGSLVLGLLPIYESLKQAVTHKNVNDGLIKGVEQIKRQFDDLLEDLKVERVKTVGEKFNPEFHEAVGKRLEKDQAAGIILEEVKGGYLIRGKVLVPAKVIVNG